MSGVWGESQQRFPKAMALRPGAAVAVVVGKYAGSVGEGVGVRRRWSIVPAKLDSTVPIDYYFTFLRLPSACYCIT